MGLVEGSVKQFGRQQSVALGPVGDPKAAIEKSQNMLCKDERSENEAYMRKIQETQRRKQQLMEELERLKFEIQQEVTAMEEEDDDMLPDYKTPRNSFATNKNKNQKFNFNINKPKPIDKTEIKKVDDGKLATNSQTVKQAIKPETKVQMYTMIAMIMMGAIIAPYLNYIGSN